MRSRRQPAAAFTPPEQCQRVRYGYWRVQAEIVRLAIGSCEPNVQEAPNRSARDSLGAIFRSGQHFEYRPRFPNELAQSPKLRKGFACILSMLKRVLIATGAPEPGAPPCIRHRAADRAKGSEWTASSGLYECRATVFRFNAPGDQTAVTKTTPTRHSCLLGKWLAIGSNDFDRHVMPVTDRLSDCL
jgi:hypothetical protein